MLKSIFIFIKAHAIATAITTTVVVGTAVAAPIAVNNYILDKQVKENLNMLASSNYQSSSNDATSSKNNEATSNNETIDNSEKVENTKPIVNTKEPLTFRIEKEYYKKEGGEIVKDMQGNDAIEGSVEGVSYIIVPSYDKDYSKWTNEEKKAYQKALEEIRRMAEEEYNKNVANEENAMLEATMTLQKVMESYSKDYSFIINKRKYGSI